MTFPLPGSNFSHLTLSVKATTGVAGFALQNGTPTILSWTAPNDGQLHRFMVHAGMSVAEAETGGQVSVSFFLPDSTEAFSQLFSGGQGAGFNFGFSSFPWVCGPGTTVSVVQVSALTAGAATLWAEIWGL